MATNEVSAMWAQKNRLFEYLSWLVNVGSLPVTGALWIQMQIFIVYVLCVQIVYLLCCLRSDRLTLIRNHSVFTSTGNNCRMHAMSMIYLNWDIHNFVNLCNLMNCVFLCKTFTQNDNKTNIKCMFSKYVKYFVTVLCTFKPAGVCLAYFWLWGSANLVKGTVA
jgi:hypothetical protein